MRDFDQERWDAVIEEVAFEVVLQKSRRAAAGRAQLLANFFGGAVWGVFRENANCGDPPGTLRVPSGYPPGTLYISPGPN